MKAFIVLIAVVAAASANAINRAAGWGKSDTYSVESVFKLQHISILYYFPFIFINLFPGSPGTPPNPSVDLELAPAAADAATGQSSASQALTQTAVRDIKNRPDTIENFKAEIQDKKGSLQINRG